MKVRIRGIYSTALTQLLLEHNFEIVDQSPIANERFKLENEEKGADILIYDKEDLNGITIHGEGSEQVVELLRKYFKEIFIRKMEIGTIYCGIIRKFDQRNKNILIDLGGSQGILPLHHYWGYLKEGEKVLVQTKGYHRDLYLLSTQLRIFGNNLILIKNGFTKVSKHIKDEEENRRLLSLSHEAKIRGYGVLWKALAQGKSDEELLKEMMELFKKEEQIKQFFQECNGPQLLEKGLLTYFIDFGPEAKAKLDELRKKVTPTICKHHELKSFNYMELVDLAESLAEKFGEDVVENCVNSILQKSFPPVGSLYTVVCKKLNGKSIVIKGKIEEITPDIIKLKRTIRYRGSYDGLNLKTELGDYAITKVRRGAEFLLHEYYNSKGELKGKYYSICTPIEISPRFARCIDLEVDVVEDQEGRRIIDVDKLEDKFKDGIISEEIYKKAKERAESIYMGEGDGI
ncbi:MAG: DUF402 domain-containing protein [Candidatus Nanoarchaeia archaeon]|nr:ribonuclease E/G [Candidatus Haiyanarchaeum thermophilum]MCW1303015.1 ribonuclease E/G [Candidatus Haiyanarchaeum thermophilum]MCW1303693.1 ribonuclease E/G [Candidatus Haiyanarchaeum thermophilum]MCW1306373.1 ribonuclease E/G [Candidatus Haiyanarchaeum thermophilum]MCW1307117.1 ribonuclease E/G [Candidatus Haiyanarchaeum thermophilum]